MHITAPGQYRTRSGDIAHVLAIIDCDYEPVVGYIMDTTAGGVTYPVVRSWGLDGKLFITLVDEDDIVGEV